MADNDAETIKSIMALTGGVLSFAAVVIGIINAKLQKAKTAAARERVISNAFGVAAGGFPLAGMVLLLGLGAERAGLLLFGLGTAFVSMDYLRKTTPASRAQTLGVVMSWFLMTLLVTFHLLSRVIGLIERMADALERSCH